MNELVFSALDGDVVTLTGKDLDDLRHARTLLEHPSLAARMTGVLGTPIEKGLELLPANWSGALSTATRVALTRALDVAVATMDDRLPGPAANRLHKLTLAATGALGGPWASPRWRSSCRCRRW